jgi:hypothetical protein
MRSIKLHKALFLGSAYLWGKPTQALTRQVLGKLPSGWPAALERSNAETFVIFAARRPCRT